MDRVPNTAEVLAALSRALDLVEGQPAGHAVRTAFVALRIAEELGLSEVDREDLLYAALLKDSGCSSNAVRIHGLFGGDEFVAKHAVKFTKWCSPVANAIYGLQHIGRGERFLARFQRLLRAIPQTSGKANFMAEVTAARCTRGAEIARQLGFRSPVGRAIHDLDEHWDGKGASQGLVGPATPLIARILCCAQTLEVFAYERGTEVAFRMLRARKGKWFDPAVVNAALVLRQDAHFWETNRTRDAHAVSQLPLLAGEVPDADADLDAICAAFAMIVDAKSSFTAEHSTRVTGYALGLADDLGLSASEKVTLRRAALLHDVGKLGVSSGILEKDGKLTDEEFAQVRLHPQRTHEILAPIAGFEELANLAGAHHERLDGKGYWQGWSDAKLDRSMRILAASDVMDALSADRPYRGAMPVEKVFAILEGDAGAHLDHDCVAALKSRYFAAPLRLAA